MSFLSLCRACFGHECFKKLLWVQLTLLFRLLFVWGWGQSHVLMPGYCIWKAIYYDVGFCGFLNHSTKFLDNFKTFLAVTLLCFSRIYYLLFFIFCIFILKGQKKQFCNTADTLQGHNLRYVHVFLHNIIAYYNFFAKFWISFILFRS